MNKLRNIWLFFVVVTSLIILIQLVSAKYENNRLIPISWLLISILPLSFFIFSRRTSRLSTIQVNIYGITLLTILLIEPVMTKSTESSSISILSYSFSIILLYQLILVFSNKNKLKKEMLEEDKKIDFDKLKILISNNFYDEVFDDLEDKKNLYHQRYYNDLLLLKGKYKIQKRDKDLNLASHSDTRIDDTKFLNGLIETITEIENFCNSRINNKK